MYESKRVPPISHIRFIKRVLVHSVVSLGLLMLSLLIGMSGYEYFEGLAWRDAFLNSAMLLGGMGPVNAPQTDGGKLFAGLYALYAGLVFLIVVALILSPVVHRILHKYHWDQDDDN
jgi:hypothetical protein